MRRLAYFAGLLVGLSCLTACTPNRVIALRSMDEYPALVGKIRAHRVMGSATAQARRLSLPLPRGMSSSLVYADLPTQIQPVGYWPEVNGRRNGRRMLLFTCGGSDEQVAFKQGQPAGGVYQGPTATVTVLDKRYET